MIKNSLQEKYTDVVDSFFSIAWYIDVDNNLAGMNETSNIRLSFVLWYHKRPYLMSVLGCLTFELYNASQPFRVTRTQQNMILCRCGCGSHKSMVFLKKRVNAIGMGSAKKKIAQGTTNSWGNDWTPLKNDNQKKCISRIESFQDL